MIPVPFILLLVTPIFSWLKQTDLFRPMVEKLEKMMEKAEDPNVKQAIEQAIDTIEM